MSDDKKPTRFERLASIGLGAQSLEPRGSRGMDPLEISDLAGAARAMPDVVWKAFLLVYREDRSPGVVSAVRAWLTLRAVDHMIADGIKPAERGKPETRTVESLVELVLLDAVGPRTFRNQADLARWWGISEAEWSRSLARRFTRLAQDFKGLEAEAAVHLVRGSHGG